MKKKTIHLPFGIQNKLLEAFLQSRAGVIASNWIFQGMRYMNPHERMYRLFTEMLIICVCSLLLNAYGTYWFLLIFVIVHSLYWIFNGHIFVLLRYISHIKFNSVNFYNYVVSLRSRLEKKAFLLGVVSYGSISKNNWTSTSDYDVRLFRNKGLWNSILTFNCCFLERARAFFAGFPLDIYVFDLDEVSQKIKQDEPAIVLSDPLNKIRERYPSSLMFDDAIVQNVDPTKVAICSTGELYGGVEEWILTFVQSLPLTQHNFEYCIVLFSDGLLYDRLEELNVNVRLLKKRWRYSLLLLLDIYRIFKEENVQIVHTHGSKANLFYGIVAKCMKKKLLKTEHGLPEPVRGVGIRMFRRALNTYFNKLIEGIFDKVVYVSYAVKEKC